MAPVHKYEIDKVNLKAIRDKIDLRQYNLAVKFYKEVASKDYTEGYANSLFSKKLKADFTRAEVEVIARILSEKASSEENEVVYIVEQFCDKKPSIVTYDIAEIFAIYETLDKDDLVSIVSQDGFLEAHDEGLLSKMVQLVKKGVCIRYYYPNLKDLPSKSHKDYLILKERFSSYGDVSKSSIASYMVHGHRRDLFGFGTRYIVISRWSDDKVRQEVRFVFLYIETSKPGPPTASKEMVRAWIPLHDIAANQYLKQLHRSSEPVTDLALRDDRLRSPIQEAYHRLFSDTKNIETYKDMRCWIGSESSISYALDLLKPVFNTRNTPSLIKVLDIGTGDGKVLELFVKGFRDQLDPKHSIHITVIEPAHFPQGDRSKIIKEPSPAHLNWSTFEEYDEEGSQESFDVIVSWHSFYVIDPTYLKKVYNLLSDEGSMLIAISPLKDNIINRLTVLIDDILVNAEEVWRVRPKNAYDGKVVREDPFRNFAEDIEECLKQYFGDRTVLRKTVTYELDLSLLVIKERLTAQCRHILDLLGGRELSKEQIDSYEHQIVNSIMDVAKNDKVKSNMTIYMASKADVRKHLATVVNGL